MFTDVFTDVWLTCAMWCLRMCLIMWESWEARDWSATWIGRGRARPRGKGRAGVTGGRAVHSRAVHVSEFGFAFGRDAVADGVRVVRRRATEDTVDASPAPRVGRRVYHRKARNFL